MIQLVATAAHINVRILLDLVPNPEAMEDVVDFVPNPSAEGKADYETSQIPEDEGKQRGESASKDAMTQPA